MNRTLVLCVVGLTRDLLGDDTPHLKKLAARGGVRPLRAPWPAVTCSAHATFTTGLTPRDHGVVANGWYFRELSEVMFWRQSNNLVEGEKIWDAARKLDPAFTCAQLFWWYNMYARVDWAITPRPMYPADGRKLPDIHTDPPELRDELTAKFGTFPLFQFWGPGADLVSSQWIARAAAWVEATRRPTLNLVYLPHLDYALQRLGPEHPGIRKELRAIDAVAGELIESALERGQKVVVLSEYGITPVTGAVHINRVLRRAGLITVREELGRELLDPGLSAAFAVADHQIAHIYVRDRARVPEVRALIESLPGVERVFGAEEKAAIGLDHPRSGELVAVTTADHWFTYYYWLDDDRAPDFARTVDIHRKPGYDPVELFIDPKIHWPSLRIGWRVLKKTVGLRMLMDVIGLDASLVRGSHGRPTDRLEAGPLIIASEPELLPPAPVVESTQVKSLILDCLTAPRHAPTRARPVSAPRM